MKTTERFDVQYYKSKIKEVNGKDGDNSFAIQVSKLVFGASMTIKATL